MLVNAGSGKCLAAQGGGTADNTTYVQTTCASRAPQLFSDSWRANSGTSQSEAGQYQMSVIY